MSYADGGAHGSHGQNLRGVTDPARHRDDGVLVRAGPDDASGPALARDPVRGDIAGRLEAPNPAELPGDPGPGAFAETDPIHALQDIAVEASNVAHDRKRC